MKLHPDKGLNPRLTVCTQCGADVGLALLGEHNIKYTCPKCGCVHFGPPDHHKCGKCEEPFSRVWKKEEIGENEKLPGGLCDACRKQADLMKEVVAEGGIYWKCTVCGSNGAIKSSSSLCAMVREKMGIAPPAPCGIEFHGAEEGRCPVCSEKAEKEQKEDKT